RERVRLARCAKARDRRHLPVPDGRDRQDARAHRLALDVHGASTALREPAAEVRVVQAELAAQCVEQRHLGLRLDGNTLAVDGETDHRHGSPPWIRSTILPLPCPASDAAYAFGASSSEKVCVTCGLSLPRTAQSKIFSSRCRAAWICGFSMRTSDLDACGGTGVAESATSSPPRSSASSERTCASPPSVSSTMS